MFVFLKMGIRITITIGIGIGIHMFLYVTFLLYSVGFWVWRYGGMYVIIYPALLYSVELYTVMVFDKYPPHQRTANRTDHTSHTKREAKRQRGKKT